MGLAKRATEDPMCALIGRFADSALRIGLFHRLAPVATFNRPLRGLGAAWGLSP